VTFAKPLRPSSAAGRKGAPSPADEPDRAHDLEPAEHKGRSASAVDTGRGLQPKAKVETLHPHFDGEVPDVTGVIELALPCAGLCDHAGMRVPIAARGALGVTDRAAGCRPVAGRSAPSGGRSGRRSPGKQKGRRLRTGPDLLFSWLVAGAGFEPATFGL
jgi:hypothetical protein